MTRSRPAVTAFTLIEMIVALAIISALVALAIPAVQALRESSRRSQCGAQIKRIAVAWLDHESAQNHLPTGGFGWDWVGSADRGFGIDQPGGWTYNILPYMEASALHDAGLGSTIGELQKAKFRHELVQSPFPNYYCPSRRAAAMYPLGGVWISSNAGSHSFTSKSDYAANVGDSERDADDGFVLNGWGPTPEEVRDASLGTMFQPTSAETRNGLQFKQSTVRLNQIIDGAAQTYLVGEKYLSPEAYHGLQFRDQDTGDNESAFVGFDRDHCRSTFNPPQQDTAGFRADHEFGGPHSGGFNISFCDGSLRFVSFDVDPKVHADSGNRRNRNDDVK